MKLFTSGWITISVTACVIGFAGTPVRGQTLAADEIRTPSAYGLAVQTRPAYGARQLGDPDGSYDPAMPPFEVVRIVRAAGYEPLGVPMRRTLGQGYWVYTISAIDPDGYDGRVVLDGRNGRIVRFIPAEFSDVEVSRAYGMPTPLPLPGPLPGERTIAPAATRPPSALPRVASRKPVAPTAERSRVETQNAETHQSVSHPVRSATLLPAQSSPGPVQAKEATADARIDATARPVEATPPVKLQPTREMPPVQGLD